MARKGGFKFGGSFTTIMKPKFGRTRKKFGLGLKFGNATRTASGKSLVSGFASGPSSNLKTGKFIP